MPILLLWQARERYDRNEQRWMWTKMHTALSSVGLKVRMKGIEKLKKKQQQQQKYTIDASNSNCV